MKNVLLFILSICISSASFAQLASTQYRDIDIQSYEFHIAVNDSSNVIHAEAKINVLFNSNKDGFKLDLENKDVSKKGMVVSNVSINDSSVQFNHENDALLIYDSASSGDKKTYSISYYGIPKDGLVIANNKFGDRTFFGDNWPNRAHQWLPTVDHPSDKALVEWHVTAPSHYQVIGNGSLIEETNLNDNTKYIWKTNVPLPTKVMVIGIAKFAVQQIGETHNIPISSWVYPQNKKEGFYDYALAKNIINFFIENVGPYPYTKLASVQSKTRYGGMENASNIFYFENSVSGNRNIENLMVHEIAHQWFGNSASEIDWPHIWLSEGFATYFTNLYVEETKGDVAFKKLVDEHRDQIIKFSKKQLTPVVDYETKNLMGLLNANSYQKGGWVLHMLRKKVGDQLFWESIRRYYDTFAKKNASTENLKHVFEDVTGQSLDTFFTQWLNKPGHPILKTSWKSDSKHLIYSIEQVQQSNVIFTFPLELKIVYANKPAEIVTLNVNDRESKTKIKIKGKVKTVIADPNSWLLFEKKQN